MESMSPHYIPDYFYFFDSGEIVNYVDKMDVYYLADFAISLVFNKVDMNEYRNITVNSCKEALSSYMSNFNNENKIEKLEILFKSYNTLIKYETGINFLSCAIKFKFQEKFLLRGATNEDIEAFRNAAEELDEAEKLGTMLNKEKKSK